MSYSVVIRTKNSASTIALCLNSILAQTELPEKILIVDSGSTDCTLETAKSFNLVEILHYPKDEEFNYSKALNIGLIEVSTRYALIISSHVDLAYNEVISKMLNIINNDKLTVAVSISWGRNRREIKNFTTSSFELKYRNIDIETHKGFAMTNTCSLIEMDKWKLYPFNENILRCEDQEWSIHFIKKGNKTVFISSKLINYRNQKYNAKKDFWDYVYIDNYIYPGFITDTFIRGKLKALKHSIINVDLKESFHLLKVISLLKFVKVSPKSIVAKYF